MTAENFAYWLQGLFELQPDMKNLTESQVAMIRQHLGYVFNKLSIQAPSVGLPTVPGYPLQAPHRQPYFQSPSYIGVPFNPSDVIITC